MIRNRYNYLTPKGKKDVLKATASQSKHYKQKAKRTVSLQQQQKKKKKKKKKRKKNGQTVIQNKKNHPDIHAKTYNDRNSKFKKKKTKQKGLPLETKSIHNHENRRLGLTESLHMQYSSLRGCILQNRNFTQTYMQRHTFISLGGLNRIVCFFLQKHLPSQNKCIQMSEKSFRLKDMATYTKSNKYTFSDCRSFQ